MRTKLLVAGALSAAVGCVLELEPTTSQGNGDPPDPVVIDAGSVDPPDIALIRAKQAFDANVYPILAAKCSGSACHAENGWGATIVRFVATDPAEGWALARSTRPLVPSFLVSNAINTVHNGVSYTASEIAKIAEWLDLELTILGAEPVRAGYDASVFASRP
ncbi:MAG: hypothetical protein AB7O24_20300 [Kofleriaceae bacterium]